jgi:Holliday junction resolvasome RuvABC ATP-dependent DNA helicase subunit
LILDEIKGCKENNEPFSHTFISAPAGHGKTLLAEIIAELLNKKVVFTTGGQLKSEQQFVDKINECEGGVIIIDEANKLPDKVGFFMLPTIEKFEVDGKSLIPFTVIFMTTHKGDIAKNLDALIQRCDLQLELNHYNEEELITILKHYKNKQYPNKNVSEDIYRAIAKNCKNTPRMARTLVRKYIFSRDWERVLKMNKIVKDGLTDVDIKVLNYIKGNGGASKGSIACFLRVKPSTYEFEIEPYLIHKELLEVKNKRKITEKGIKFLKEI